MERRGPRSTCLFIKLTSEDLNELKIPEMQVSTKLQSSNRAIFSLAHLEAPLPFEQHGFSRFSRRQCGVYLEKSFCYGIAHVLAIAYS